MKPLASIVTRHVAATDTKPARICVEIRDFPRRYYDRGTLDESNDAHEFAARRRIAELNLNWGIGAHTIVNDSHVFTVADKKPRRFVYHYSVEKARVNHHRVHTVELYEVIEGKPLMPQGRKLDTFTSEAQIVRELMQERKLWPEDCHSLYQLTERGVFVERV